MKMITIDSQAYKSLVRKIDHVYNYIREQSEKQGAAPDPSAVWIDNGEAAELLEISQRTLQRLRSNGEITYSIRGGRTWYTLDEIQRVMAGRLVASKYRKEDDLIEAHHSYHERSKAASKNKNNTST